MSAPYEMVLKATTKSYSMHSREIDCSTCTSVWLCLQYLEKLSIIFEWHRHAIPMLFSKHLCRCYSLAVVGCDVSVSDFPGLCIPGCMTDGPLMRQAGRKRAIADDQNGQADIRDSLRDSVMWVFTSDWNQYRLASRIRIFGFGSPVELAAELNIRLEFGRLFDRIFDRIMPNYASYA